MLHIKHKNENGTGKVFTLKRMDTNWCCHLVALVVNTQNTSIITDIK